MFRVISLSLCLLFSVLLSPILKAKEVVTLWSYYDYPPFVVSLSDKKGLNYDFVEMLNLFELDSPYEYELKIIPRKRLDSYLNMNQKGVVLWVNPIFFADKKREKFAWTNKVLEDEQSFISRAKTPFIYKGPESLMTKGFVLGGVRGHLYGAIQKDIDAGKIVRSDVSNAKQNIGMLLKDRVDSFLIPLSTMKYFEKEMKLTHKIYYSPTPLNRYTRHLLVNHNEEVYKTLSNVVDKLHQDEYWKILLDQYGLSLPSEYK
jgi:polar amino acid transport system substrate-binding protein